MFNFELIHHEVIMSSVLSALAIWRPAVYQTPSQGSIQTLKDFKVDETSILFRTAAIAIAGIALTVRSIMSFSPYTSLFAYGLYPIIHGTYIYEHRRGIKEINQQVIKLFFNQNYVLPETKEYIKTKPEVVAALLADFKTDRTVEKESKLKDLFESLIAKTDKTSLSEEYRAFVTSLKVFIDNKDLFSSSLFVKVFESQYLEVKIYALEKDAVKSQDLTPEELFDCWTHVEDHNLAHLLVQKGFDINVQNSQGETPLMWAIKFDLDNSDREINRKQTILSLLKGGAQVPDLNSTIQVKAKTKVEGVEIEQLQDIRIIDFLKKDPVIAEAFLQAISYQSNTANSNSFTTKSNKSEGLLFCLKFWKPAVCTNVGTFEFGVKDNHIFIRSLMVALPILGGWPFALLCPAYIPAMLPFVAMPFLWYKYDWSRATKALNEVAVQQFQHMFPSARASQHVVLNESAIDQLIANQADLTKLDDNGKTLWDLICQQDSYSNGLIKLSTAVKCSIFIKLADQFFASNVPKEQKCRSFLIAVKSAQPAYVEYLLKSGKIKASDLSAEQQFECWMSLKHTRMATVFKNYGFDVNVVNATGHTPLLACLNKFFFKFSSYDLLDEYQYVQTLLNNGANPRAYVDVQRRVKLDTCVTKTMTAIDFINERMKGKTDPNLKAIKKLLEDALKSEE